MSGRRASRSEIRRDGGAGDRSSRRLSGIRSGSGGGSTSLLHDRERDRGRRGDHDYDYDDDDLGVSSSSSGSARSGRSREYDDYDDRDRDRERDAGGGRRVPIARARSRDDDFGKPPPDDRRDRRKSGSFVAGARSSARLRRDYDNDDNDDFRSSSSGRASSATRAVPSGWGYLRSLNVRGGVDHIVLSKREETVGRGSDCHPRSLYTNPACSGRHATFSEDRGEFWLLDTSSNGTFLNKRAIGRNKEKRIYDGDIIVFCVPSTRDPDFGPDGVAYEFLEDIPESAMYDEPRPTRSGSRVGDRPQLVSARSERERDGDLDASSSTSSASSGSKRGSRVDRGGGSSSKTRAPAIEVDNVDDADDCANADDDDCPEGSMRMLRSINDSTWDDIEWRMYEYEEIVIGRAPDCHEASLYNDPTISSRHARFFVRNGRAWVEDTSSNGTYVNGALIGRGKKKRLDEGDMVSLVVPDENHDDFDEETVIYQYRVMPDDGPDDDDDEYTEEGEEGEEYADEGYDEADGEAEEAGDADADANADADADADANADADADADAERRRPSMTAAASSTGDARADSKRKMLEDIKARRAAVREKAAAVGSAQQASPPLSSSPVASAVPAPGKAAAKPGAAKPQAMASPRAEANSSAAKSKAGAVKMKSVRGISSMAARSLRGAKGVAASPRPPAFKVPPGVTYGLLEDAACKVIQRRYRFYAARKRYPMLKKRLAVVREIYSSEVKYVSAIEMVVTQFKNPLEKYVDDTYSGDKRQAYQLMVSTIFSNIDKVYEAQLAFKKLMERVMMPFAFYREWAAPIEQSLRAPELATLYSDFAASYKTALDATHNLPQDLDDKLYECTASTGSGIQLSSLLIQPIQRPPRYVLLLGELLKQTKFAHPDTDAVRSLLDAAKVFVDLVNENERMADVFHTFVKVQFTGKAQCHLCTEQIWSLGGMGGKNGYACKRCHIAFHKRCLYQNPPLDTCPGSPQREISVSNFSGAVISPNAILATVQDMSAGGMAELRQQKMAAKKNTKARKKGASISISAPEERVSDASRVSSLGTELLEAVKLPASDAQLTRITELLRQGAPLDGADDEEKTPLHHVALSRNDAAARALLAAGANVNLQDREGNTPLLYAASVGNMSMVNELCRFGANAALLNARKSNAMHYIPKKISVDDMEDDERHELLVTLFMLVQNGLDVNQANSVQETPLHICVMFPKGRDLYVAFLLELGADPRLSTAQGWSPLHILMLGKAPNENVVEMLCCSGADVNQTSSKGTPREMAEKRSTAVQQLLDGSGSDWLLEEYRHQFPRAKSEAQDVLERRAKKATGLGGDQKKQKRKSILATTPLVSRRKPL